jgi:hypothetical protein
MYIDFGVGPVVCGTAGELEVKQLSAVSYQLSATFTQSASVFGIWGSKL